VIGETICSRGLIRRERILALEARIPDLAAPEFGFNSLEK
jgi:hypothetical protein